MFNFRKILSFLLCVPLLNISLAPGMSSAQARDCSPVMLLGLKVDPQNPFRLHFIFDAGDTPSSQENLAAETQKQIHYFLAALTLPKQEQWVNLSPVENNRIIPEALSLTDLGRDMLQQDFVLKQTAASLTNPQTALGQKYWQALEAVKLKSSSALLSKIWILPDQAVVNETPQGVFVEDRHLKVKMDDPSPEGKIFRQLILPKIEKEVNDPTAFGTLQQIYNAMILAVWYKQRLHDGLLAQVYSDRSKVTGIDRILPGVKQEIYEHYLQGFKNGAYQIIEESLDDETGNMIPRKYFSGGVMPVEHIDIHQSRNGYPVGKAILQSTVDLYGISHASTPIATLDPKAEFHPISSAFEVGQRNTVGTFMPLQQVRTTNDWGIGDFGGMLKGVDLHAALGQSLIQVLPLNKSSADDSPYSVQSSLMLDEIYISAPDVQKQYATLAGEQFITEHEDQIRGLHENDEVTFTETRDLKRAYLKTVWEDVKDQQHQAVHQFLAGMNYANYGSLEDHILYGILKNSAIQKESEAGVDWTRSRQWDWRLWEDKIRDRDPDTLAKLKEEYREQIDFEAFVQMTAYEQFRKLRDYGRQKGVALMVDIPYALDGADIWINPAVFGLKKENGYRAMTKQGVPPEPAYQGGQYWQFFPYDWSHAGTIPFILQRYHLTQELTDAQRLDHVLGFYRQFRFIEDVRGQLTLKSLGLFKPIQKIQQAAKDANTQEAKHDAVQKVSTLIIKKLLDIRRERPSALGQTLPDNALNLLMNDTGQLYPNHLIQVARAVPLGEYANLQGPHGWQRQYVAEQSVFNNQQKWDMIRVTPDVSLNDQGFLYEYLFGEGSGLVQADDSLRPGYFELSPGDDLMTRFLAMAQERGSLLVWETLGVVPSAVQTSVDHLGGVNYNPGIWGDEKFWGDKPNPYHYDHHLPNSYATLSLHDSSTEKVRWENEIPPQVKESLLNEWFGVGNWNREDADHLTERVLEKLLEKFVYASPARVGVAAWVDLLGLGDDYRLNSPGRQGGQWRKRLLKEAEVDTLLAATQGTLAVDLAAKVTNRIKNLTQLGGRQSVQAQYATGTIVHVNPQAGGQIVQMRRTDEPFLIDAYVQAEAKDVTAVIKDDKGQTTVLSLSRLAEDLAKQQVMGIFDDIKKWSVRFYLPHPGDYSFTIVSQTADGNSQVSLPGQLKSVLPEVSMNPLDSQYLIEKKTSSSAVDTVGGIDLNPDALMLQIKGNGRGFNSSVEKQIPLMINLQGLRPVVTKISYIKVGE